MIRETKRKIYFTEYIPATRGRQKDLSKPPFATINAKSDTIVFSKSCVEKLEMKDGFIKFFHNHRNIIGWKVVSNLNDEEFKSKIYRLVKPNPKSGVYVTTVGAIIKQLSIRLEPTTYKCEVMRYREASDLLSRGDITYFIKLSKSQDDDEDN